ncbi:glycosyl transferase family 1 [Rhizobium sp. FY34]|uniref:glycosyl transferase family 1 n=1 Tax=Rhizobium sp. FY34 TaxID=2562309 RepID=UPI001FEDF2FD|nr:glycosyl transferase family 1 [Rhizobium sp. FY34]
MTLNVLYLAHDLSDPAIRRRVMMLKAGGATVTVAGFLRDENRMAGDPQVKVVVLGETADGRLGQRVAAVVKARLSLASLLSGVARPDVILARNLEVLALSGSTSAQFGGSVPIVYECLDIHRLLLDRGMKGRMLRAAEGFFGRSACLLATSSPAFVEHYFKPLSKLDLPILLLENKVLELEPTATATKPAPRPPAVGQPWRIGWFGAIRCRKSFAILSAFAAAMQGRVEVVIRGRVSPKEFPDFEAMVEGAAHVSFHGTYRNPEDLARIYDEVQFVWAIDFFEEGLNSLWLLPNRLYEGALHGAVPIALSATETGRFLAARQIGLLLDRADPQALQQRFDALDGAEYQALFDALAATERTQWVTDRSDCQALVRQLAALGRAAPAPAGLTIPSPLQSEG